MDEDMALIRRVIGDIARDYKLHPKAAAELLVRIIAILRQYQNEEEHESGEEET